jgi:AraC family transcriptional regulator of adaptative response/methylated-DNA-[protein]-cysteine methyltransferase
MFKKTVVVAMREIIRVAWGISSLGDFLVAMFEKGIANLEFSAMQTAFVAAKRRIRRVQTRHRQASHEW